MLISLDTEDTGLDLALGARPFLVTVCHEDGTQKFWEWHVDPATREVAIQPEDAREIRDLVATADGIVGHNLKFDSKALQYAGIVEEWPWHKCQDTLVAGHLLASGMPHNLTDMVLHYLGEDIKPWEDALKDAVLDCRRKVKSINCDADDDLFDAGKNYKWRTAKKGDPIMPSAGSDAWRFDYWLPRAYAEYAGLPTGDCTVVNRRDEPFDVDIGRPGLWGNPFRIGGVYTRESAVERYREWVVQQPELVRDLKTLAGKRLGCWCKPLPCHGDVLRELVKERCAHPYWTVCSKYANADSAYTLLLWRRLEAELRAKGLWLVYRESMRLPGILASMETRGVSYDLGVGEKLIDEYAAESIAFGEDCRVVAKSLDYDLDITKGTNNSLRWFAFGYDECSCNACGLKFNDSPGKLHACKGKKCKSSDVGVVKRPALDLPPQAWSETGPSLNKESFDVWLVTLDGEQLRFVRSLAGKRKADTAISFLEAYKRYGVPVGGGMVTLHTNNNQTGTLHLRHSSNDPNMQNVSKQKKPCVACGATGERNGAECRTCHGEGEANYNLRRPIMPQPGREFWALDYENIELKIPAFYCGERLMIELFEHPDKPPYFGSQHLLNASIIYPETFWPVAEQRGEFKRRYASTDYQYMKNFAYALGYQCGEATGDRSARRKGAWRKQKETFKELDKLAASNYAFASKHGYVELIPDKSVDPTRGYTIMTARGSRGDLSPTIPHCYWTSGNACWAKRRAMVRCQEELDRWNTGVLREAGLYDATCGTRAKHLDQHGYHMSLEIHDELLFDFPAGGRRNWGRAMRLKRLMEESGDDISIPLTVAVSWHPHNWAESEELFPREVAA